MIHDRIPTIRYLRVSSESQSSDKKYGFARQTRIAERNELKFGLEVVEVVTNIILGATETREGLDSLAQRAKETGALAISLSEADRLTRAELTVAYAILRQILNIGLDVYAGDLSKRVNVRDPAQRA